MSEVKTHSDPSTSIASPPLATGHRLLTTDHSFSLRQVIIVAIVMLTSLGGYLLVLKWRGDDAVFITKTNLDDVIPFQPAWVWVYLIPYVIGPVVIGFLRRPTFNWYISRGIAVVLVTLLIFIMVPTQTGKRPPHDLGTSVTGQLYQNMIAIDEPPANAAPSLHVSLTFLLGLALLWDFPRWWWLSAAAVILVWLATLFTRQHHLIDVITGVLLAAFVVSVWPAFAKTFAKRKHE
jgi:membrane-associated phospholipid phosphatase